MRDSREFQFARSRSHAHPSLPMPRFEKRQLPCLALPEQLPHTSQTRTRTHSNTQARQAGFHRRRPLRLLLPAPQTQSQGQEASRAMCRRAGGAVGGQDESAHADSACTLSLVPPLPAGDSFNRPRLERDHRRQHRSHQRAAATRCTPPRPSPGGTKLCSRGSCCLFFINCQVQNLLSCPSCSPLFPPSLSLPSFPLRTPLPPSLLPSTKQK